MATKIITTTEFVDDLDGAKAEGTISFAYSGKTYEIDLSKKNRTAFEKALKPYVDAARPVRGNRATPRAGRNDKRTDLAAVRAWAASNGYEVSSRGRIPAAVLEAYDGRG